MRVAVTGANGFIGRDLCHRLAMAGHTVTAIVRHQVSDLARFGRVVQISGPDERAAWSAALTGAEAVVHLAGRAHRGEATNATTRAEFWRINVELSRTVLEIAAASGVAHLLFMSSSKVFGERSVVAANGHIQRFSGDSVPAPAGPYGESKLAAERVLQDGCLRHGMRLTILRPPLVYGPGVGGNLRSLLAAIARGFPLPFASIKNQRSLVHRAHLNDAIELALRNFCRGTRIFTLADLELSTPELIKLMAGGVSTAARLVHFPVAGLKLVGAMTGRSAAVSRLTDSFVMDSWAIAATLNWRSVLDPVVAWAEIGRQFNAEMSR